MARRMLVDGMLHELKKVLGGTCTYRWRDDGTLSATCVPHAGPRRSPERDVST